VTTFPEFAAKMGRLPDELAQASRVGVGRAALHVTTDVRAEIRAVTGGDMRLSGVGLRGARVGARYSVKGTQNPTALIRATGPIQLIERDTQPHGIRPRRRRVKALKFADGGFYAHSWHPGTRGKHPFQKGVAKAAPDTGRIFQTEIDNAMKKVMR